MSAEEKNPNEAIDREPGKIIVVAGKKRSGRSLFIKNLLPDYSFYYDPYLASGFKTFLKQLGKCDTNSVISIETILPNINHRSESFFKELFLFAKLKKHSYIIEWEHISEEEETYPLQGTTYLKYVSTIFMTTKKEDRFVVPHGVSARFGMIAANSKKTSLHYRIIFTNKDKYIKENSFIFNVDLEESGNGRI